MRMEKAKKRRKKIVEKKTKINQIKQAKNLKM